MASLSSQSSSSKKAAKNTLAVVTATEESGALETSSHLLTDTEAAQANVEQQTTEPGISSKTLKKKKVTMKPSPLKKRLHTQLTQRAHERQKANNKGVDVHDEYATDEEVVTLEDDTDEKQQKVVSEKEKRRLTTAYDMNLDVQEIRHYLENYLCQNLPDSFGKTQLVKDAVVLSMQEPDFKRVLQDRIEIKNKEKLESISTPNKKRQQKPTAKKGEETSQDIIDKYYNEWVQFNKEREIWPTGIGQMDTDQDSAPPAEQYYAPSRRHNRDSDKEDLSDDQKSDSDRDEPTDHKEKSSKSTTSKVKPSRFHLNSVASNGIEIDVSLVSLLQTEFQTEDTVDQIKRAVDMGPLLTHQRSQNLLHVY